MVRGSRRPPVSLLLSPSVGRWERTTRNASSSLPEEISWRSSPGGTFFEPASPPEGSAPLEASSSPEGLAPREAPTLRARMRPRRAPTPREATQAQGTCRPARTSRRSPPAVMKTHTAWSAPNAPRRGREAATLGYAASPAPRSSTTGTPLTRRPQRLPKRPEQAPSSHPRGRRGCGERPTSKFWSLSFLSAFCF